MYDKYKLDQRWDKGKKQSHCTTDDDRLQLTPQFHSELLRLTRLSSL